MEAAIAAGDFDGLRRLVDEDASPCLVHCSCIQDKSARCQHLLTKAVERLIDRPSERAEQIVDYLIERGFPTVRTSLLLPAKRGDERLMRRLHSAGCRFSPVDNIFHYGPTLPLVRAAIEECGYPIVGTHRFRNAVESADDDVVDYVHAHIRRSNARDVSNASQSIALIGPSGCHTTMTPDETDCRFGYHCYHDAIYHGTLDRFLRVARDWRIPMYSVDRDFWIELLNTGKNAEFTRMYSDEAWAAGAPERRKILAWCLEHEFSFTSEALAAALSFKNEAVTTLLLGRNVPVDAKVISAALMNHPLEFCKVLLAKAEPGAGLAPNVWISTAGGLGLSAEADAKLAWLSEVNCPRPEGLIAEIIDDAPKSRLDWLVDVEGFAPTIDCWAALSNRYMLDDTDAMLRWLTARECPLPDQQKNQDVSHHMDIMRPNAWMIREYVYRLMKDTCAWCGGPAIEDGPGTVVCDNSCCRYYCKKACADQDDAHSCCGD